MSTINDIETLLDRFDDLKAEELGALLASVPSIGPRVLPPYFDDGSSGLDWFAVFGITQTVTTQDLALFFTSNQGMLIARDGLDQLQRNLLTVAIWNGGTLDLSTAMFETGLDANTLRTAATGILEIIFGDSSKDRSSKDKSNDADTLLRLRPSVVAGLNFGNSSARHGLDHATKADLVVMLKQFGAHAKSTDTREALVEHVIAFLSDSNFLEHYIQSFSKKAQEYIRKTNDGARHPFWEIGQMDYTRRSMISGPARELIESKLYFVHDESETLWMWREASVALHGRVTQPIDVAARDPQPIAGSGQSTRTPDADGNMRKLLELWSHKPPPPLSDGSIGVKPIRDAAKQLELPPETVGTLACVAVDAGFMEIVITGYTGKGYKRKAQTAWQLTRNVESWSATSAYDRWAALVQAWTFSAYARESGGLPERVDNGIAASAAAQSLRQSILAKLASTEAGFGFDATDIIKWMCFTHPSLISADSAAALLESLRILGVIEHDDPIRLSVFGRAAITGDRPHIEAGATTFLIQGDSSIVAPPDLDVDVMIELERYAQRESASGALIYRLSDANIAKQLATGISADTIIAFFRKHSTTELPQNVEYSITDAERRARTMETGTATTYIVCSDPGIMTRIVAVKPAKLRPIAPTVAVSDLSLDKVEAELAKKNVYLPTTTSRKDSSPTVETPKAQPIIDTPPLLASNAALAKAADNIRKRKLRDAKSFAAQIDRFSRF